MTASRQLLQSKGLCMALFSAALMMAGCAGRGAPDWVANPKTVYPESRYLAAVGAGETRRAAENAAAGNLARIFEARIKSDERLRDQSRETTDSFERTTDFTADISVQASETLYNIQHAEAWRDPNGRCYAVAYLERAETGLIYREKMDQHAVRIRYLLEQADAADTDPVRQYAYLRAARREAEKNAVLMRQLAVIHPASVRAVRLPYSLNEVGRRAAEAAGRIRFDASLTGETAEAVIPTLQKLVTDYGFTAGTPPILRMIGHIRIDDTGQRNAGLVFVRFELKVRIVDAQGRQLITLHEKGREGHVNLQEAEMRALRTLEQAIRSEGRRLLNTYFDQLAAAESAR